MSKKKGLFLYGANCTIDIWEDIKPYLPELAIVYVQYPHELLERAECAADIAAWVYENYKQETYDFIVGHSMGGFVALHLVTDFGMKAETLILLESNPVPSAGFYRNLMTPVHMEAYGARLKEMFEGERSYYNKKLLETLQDGFDESKRIKSFPGTIYGIYGDRGILYYENRKKDLCLTAEVENKMHIRFVENSCHMPMVENPKELAALLLKICADKKAERHIEAEYRNLTEAEINRSLYKDFNRRQIVTKCWRKEKNVWTIKEEPFIDDWSSEEYDRLVLCLKNTVKTGGLVCGAFVDGMLKGSVSVESQLFGSRQEYLDLTSIHVSADMRGSGIGKILFHHAAEWAREHGGKKLYISSHSAVESQAFYMAMGCVDAKEPNQEHVEEEPCDRQLEYILSC